MIDIKPARIRRESKDLYILHDDRVGSTHIVTAAEIRRNIPAILRNQIDKCKDNSRFSKG